MNHLESRRILLIRRGLVFAEPTAEALPETLLEALEIQLAELGFALSTRLRQRLAHLPLIELDKLQTWLWQTLAAHTGANLTHQPLFRRFPEDVPTDTHALWVRKVLAHFLQAPHQPCLFCRRIGTTHVLEPCLHVVCDQCFDGANYSACPVCEHHVDSRSPFFKPGLLQRLTLPKEHVSFKLLDLGEDADAAVESLFRDFCARKQAMSPADREDLATIVDDYGARVIAWLPPLVPVKETMAIILGGLLRVCDLAEAMDVAKEHLRTATDVLRVLATYSKADPGLQGEKPDGPFLGDGTGPARVSRFKVAPLKRPLRKALLAILEQMPFDQLAEDMLRHQAYWVWVGQFLHPHEFAKRFPNVARAFAIVRKQAPDGTRAERFRGYAARVEAAFLAPDADTLIALLEARPGELARRFDRALRVLAADEAAAARLLDVFLSRLPAFATPVLLTLQGLLPTRVRSAVTRVYWPKGSVGRGVLGPDTRPTLPAALVERAVAAIEGELLRRFALLPPIHSALVDEALRTIVVPFNERTASRAAISLPRGSSVRLPAGKLVRLFMHWCEPEVGGRATDLDLSVAFFDADWRYVGVCSYYQLRYPEKGEAAIATSAGDLRDAPFPDGATEFIDFNRDLARAAGIRYAVAVVNSYAGMAFGELERSFAGVMLRDDPLGKAFDPRSVTLKFALAGDNGVYLPLMLDLEQETLHWFDLYSKGQFDFNNVETSRRAIEVVCPAMLHYFASGIRPSMYELVLLHVAARAQKVLIRGPQVRVFERGALDAQAFLQMLRTGSGRALGAGELVEPDFAALFTGDLDLPETGSRYCLFPSKLSSNLAAADLIG
jgi:hypothetical protein